MLIREIRPFGFALPTVLLASTILLVILTTALAAVSGVNRAINGIYYQQVAHEAAESGLAYARYCYGRVGTSMASSGDLTQSTDCYGVSKSGQNCTSSPGTALCGVADASSIRSRFTVEAPEQMSGGASYRLRATGTVQLLRTSNHTVYDTITTTLSQQVSIALDGIASGNSTTCTIQTGQLYCWGSNSDGQVGNGTTSTAVTIPYHVEDFPAVDGVEYSHVQYVATGINYTCAVVGVSPRPADGNQVYCWGSNSVGQFGIGTTSASPILTPIAAATDLPNNLYVGCTDVNTDCIPISARDHTCIMAGQKLNPGDVSYTSAYCWGKNSHGQAGLYVNSAGSPPLPQPKLNVGWQIDRDSDNTPLRPTALSNVSGDGSCAVMGGAVYCWGTNSHGELGNGTQQGGAKNPAAIAADVVTSGVTKVTTNNARACAVKSGALYCWGGNGYYNAAPDYRLDSGPAVSGTWHVDSPVRLVANGQYGGAVSDFAITDWNTCVVVVGKVWCSGYNDQGQLGQGNTSGPTHGTASIPSQVRPASNMVQVKGALDGQSVTDITSGNNHFCAITANRDAYCWGGNDLGELGNGTTQDSATPTKARVPATIVF